MVDAGARSDSAGQTGSFLNMAPEVVLGKPYDQKCGGVMRLCLANMLGLRRCTACYCDWSTVSFEFVLLMLHAV
jgi:hypothetical protein